MKRFGTWKLVCVVGALIFSVVGTGAQNGRIRINVLLNTPVTDAIVADLSRFGAVSDVMLEINAAVVNAPESSLRTIQALSYVDTANPDAERKGAPIDSVAASNFTGGINMWNLDAVDVTNLQPGADRVTPFDGKGVYVAVLDTGLLDTWRQYFPEQRIATQFGRAFAGQNGNGTATNQWEHDANSHGTHVTSTILGFNFRGTPVNGVAPMATIIPVKVLGQNGSGWSSMIAKGIVYVADLKMSGALGSSPVVINMSLGGSALDAVERAAIDYAVNRGVVIVAAAGNEGEQGMSFPGAYAPVISAAATGWRGQWKPGADNNPNNWWFADQVADPTSAKDFYIADFSSRARADQDLDVAAPGSWVVGPFQLQSGNTSYFFLSGTSMASPHVAGIVALMLQKKPTLTPSVVETILESSAIRMAAGCATVAEPGTSVEQCWGSDATGNGIITAKVALAATK